MTFMPERLGPARGANHEHGASRAPLLLVAVVSYFVAACATPPPADDLEAVAEFEATNDPLEPMNRAIFDFNLFFARVALRPAANAYTAVLPQEIRDAIRGVLDNAGEPVNFFNATLQGDFRRATHILGRIVINTTLGIGGMIDVAKEDFGLEPLDEDFGQTLAVWGSKDGAYLVFPLFGPSSVRDGIGRGVDIFLDPLTYVFADHNVEFIGPIMGAVSGVDQYARNVDVLDEIERTSIDFYAALRSAYRQRRKDLIDNGKPQEVDPFLGSPADPFDNDLSYAE